MNLVDIALNAFVASTLFFVTWCFLRQNKPRKISSASKNESDSNEQMQHSISSSVIEEKQENSVIKCAGCGILEGKLKPCGRCRSVFYCGKPCQLKHWKQPNGHKQSCLKLKHAESTRRASNDFGSTSLEREELAEELDELTVEEKTDLLKAWEKLPVDQLAPPSKNELEAQLKQHKQEVSALMYEAAYKEMDEKETQALVDRVKELKDLVKLEGELLEYHAMEELMPKDGSDKESFRCLPCPPSR